MNILTLKDELKNLKDPRRTSHGNIRHKMEDIIIGLCTVICGGEDFVDIVFVPKNLTAMLHYSYELFNRSARTRRSISFGGKFFKENSGDISRITYNHQRLGQSIQKRRDIEEETTEAYIPEN